MKKVYKYGTGQEVPEGAIYLTSVVQEVITQLDNVTATASRLVWHYFLVEDKKKKNNLTPTNQI